MPDFSISSRTDIATITLNQAPDRPGIGAQVFGSLWSRGLNVQLVVSTPLVGGKSNITLAVGKNDLNPALVTLKKIQQDIGAESLTTNSNVALICLNHPSLASTPGIASRLFSILSQNQINVEAVSSSPTSITCIIAGPSVLKAIEALNQEFKAETA